MIESLSFIILGLILGSVPLCIWYLKKSFKENHEKCLQIKTDLSETLKSLNKLHNSAIEKYLEIETKTSKLETEIAALKYGKVSNK